MLRNKHRLTTSFSSTSPKVFQNHRILQYFRSSEHQTTNYHNVRKYRRASALVMATGQKCKRGLIFIDCSDLLLFLISMSWLRRPLNETQIRNHHTSHIGKPHSNSGTNAPYVSSQGETYPICNAQKYVYIYMHKSTTTSYKCLKKQKNEPKCTKTPFSKRPPRNAQNSVFKKARREIYSDT